MRHFLACALILFASAAYAEDDPLLDCASYVDVGDYKIDDADASKLILSSRISAPISNKSPFAISYVKIAYEVKSGGRSVPWATAYTYLDIPGGIEPGETRKLTWNPHNLPREAFKHPPLNVEIHITDISFSPEESLDCKGYSKIEDARNAALGLGGKNKLSSKETIVILDQLRRCWRPDGSNVVTLRARLEESGLINQDDIELISPDPLPDKLKKAERNARSALKDLRCQPFTLPPDKYGAWQELTVRFDPAKLAIE